MKSMKQWIPCVAVGCLLVLSQTAALAHGKGNGPGNGKGPGPHGHDLTGAWLVTIMPRNCATGDSLPNLAHEALFTFHEDGTLSVWAQNNSITLTRSPSHGIWKAGKHGNYRLTFVHLRYSLETGKYLGRQDAVATITLQGRGGDEFSMDSSATVYDADGTVAARACSNSTGVRLTLPD
jgi:hypothetical protein